MGGGGAEIVRVVTGRYAFFDRRSGRGTGSETFRLRVSVDGRRRLETVRRDAAAGRETRARLMVDADFRPLTGEATFHDHGRPAGAARVVVRGGRLSAHMQSPGTSDRHIELAVARPLSLTLHPISADGWHAWYAAAHGETQGWTFVVSAARDGRPLDVRLRPIGWRRVERETVSTPAGRFQVEQVRTGDTHVWLTVPDLIPARLYTPSVGADFVLVEYAAAAAR